MGSIGIQLAKASGLSVIATASRPETVAWVKELGADQVVNHRENLVSQIKKPVDYIANFSGELDAYWSAMAELIAPQGAMVAIVGNAKPMAMDVVRSKSATMCWELMFTRSMFNTADIAQQGKLLNEVSRLVDEGVLRTTMTERYSPINAANLKHVHMLIESSKARGKIVLEGFDAAAK